MGDSVRLPHGVRDYLPEAAAERRAIAEGLLGAFERWGYRRIVTPAFEYDAVLARGLGAQAQRQPGAQMIRFVEPATGEVVALRPDITPQVARLVATRLQKEKGPIRLAYEGSVVRMGGGARPQRELFQAGVELVEAPSPTGDVEVIALAAAGLEAAGLSRFTLDLGEASLARAALDGIAGEVGGELAQAVGRKDAEEVGRIARGLDVSAKRRKLIEALPSLYGGAEVIARAASLLERGQGEARAGLAALSTVVERLEGLELGARISIDLGEVRGFDYYTGVRFQGFAPGVGEAVLSGGRYDRLIERYGRPARAAGFAVDVERVALGLRACGGLPVAAAGGVLVSGEAAGAGRLARALRRAGERAAQDLGEKTSDSALAAQARAAGLGRVIVVGGKGSARWFPAGGGRGGAIPAARMARAIAGAVPLDALLGAR